MPYYATSVLVTELTFIASIELATKVAEEATKEAIKEAGINAILAASKKSAIEATK